ncbi:MAG: hypothetical protein NT014_05455 [Candidatus Omnitrophica bacterium]|nr:hypothetical protein [Candidatus Omnitrophota bacterium]
MPKKLKFKPEITRIKLNPEQAVLSCSCYDVGMQATESGSSLANGDADNCCNGKSYDWHWACNPGGTGTSRSVKVYSSGAS